MGLRWLRHHARICALRPPGGRRRSGRVGLGSGHERALGGLVRLLAPPGCCAAGAVTVMKKTASTAGESPSRLIDARIKDLGDWRGRTLARVRALIKQVDPDVVETWKWRGVPVWEHDGMICTGETYKDIVKITFAKGAELKDPSRVFNSGLDGNVRRAIDIHEGEKVNEAALKDLVRAAITLNVAGKSKAKAKPRRASR